MAASNRSSAREIRLRYQREKPQKAWRPYELDLLNLTRKVRPGERIAVVIFAEQLAMNRIRARLQHRRLASQEVRHG